MAYGNKKKLSMANGKTLGLVYFFYFVLLHTQNLIILFSFSLSSSSVIGNFARQKLFYMSIFWSHLLDPLTKRCSTINFSKRIKLEKTNEQFTHFKQQRSLIFCFAWTVYECAKDVVCSCSIDNLAVLNRIQSINEHSFISLRCLTFHTKLIRHGQTYKWIS